MNLDFSKNHFELFGLEPAYQIDLGRVEQAFRDIQAKVHPDRFASASDAERRWSMQWATHVNEAYQTLKQPVSRARYLLQLHGMDTREDTNTAMPAEFLMQQMEWREAIMEANAAGDIDGMEQLNSKLRSEINALQQQLAQRLDVDKNYMDAAGIVRKLKFLEKLREEINHALERLES